MNRTKLLVCGYLLCVVVIPFSLKSLIARAWPSSVNRFCIAIEWPSRKNASGVHPNISEKANKNRLKSKQIESKNGLNRKRAENKKLCLHNTYVIRMGPRYIRIASDGDFGGCNSSSLKCNISTST